MPKTGQQAFDVFLHGQEIDTVFGTGFTAEEMRASLINHDGYDPGIVVKRRSPRARVTSDETPKPTPGH